MQEGLVSVVVPVYNVEKYLDRCVESIVAQTYKNIEIILVDDGSTDSCPQKCDDWKEKDSRIKVIHKQNAGAGYARNTGIENASGQYIMFADSDDYLTDNAVEMLYNNAISTKAELLLFGSCDVNDEGKVLRTVIPGMEKRQYFGKEITDCFLSAVFGYDIAAGKNLIPMISTWSYMYSMEMINKSGWRFVSERDYFSEDAYSLLILFSSVKNAAVVSNVLYFHYKDNRCSISHQLRPDSFSKIVRMYDGGMKLADEHAYPEILKKQLACYAVSSIIGAAKNIVSSEETFMKRLECVKTIIDSPRFQLILSNANKTGDSFMRRTLIFAMKNRLSLTSFFLVRIKNFGDRNDI